MQRSIRYHEIEVQQTPKTTITGYTLIIQVLEHAPLRLKDLIEKKAITLENQVKVIRQLATVLYKLHDDNFLHRDVKPDNIYLDSNFNCILSDLGIARPNNSEFKTVIGTRGYTAPEVWKIEIETEGQCLSKYDCDCDAWSLGCVVYYMQTGHDLFSGECAQETEVAFRDNYFAEYDEFPRRLIE